MNFKTSYDSENRIWKSESVEQLFNPNKSIGAIALYMLRSKPRNAVCQISDSEGTELTYGTACSYAISVASYLKELGLGCDDVVGIVGQNTTLLMPVLVGCWINGTPYNTLHPIHEEDDIRLLFALTKPKIIFCDGEAFHKVQNATNMLNAPIYTLCNHLEGVPRIQDILQPVPMAELYQAAPLKHGPNQTMVIIPSSGTTGKPKAVCRSNCKLLSEIGHTDGSSVLFSFSSPDWGTGILLIVANVLCGGTRIITTKPYTPDYLLEIITKYKVTNLTGSANQFGDLAQLPGYTAEAISSVRVIVMGGCHALPSAQTNIRAKLTRGVLVNSYGTSEIGGISLNYSDYKVDTVGRLWGGAQLKIKERVPDDVPKLMGPNEKGEIWVYTPTSWLGYYNNPEATADIMDADGWINTGDVGYMDDEGFLHLVDRSKDILKYMGFHYSPHEIEETIVVLPDVIDACVFGVYDDKEGDLAGAAVVLKPGSTLTESDIKSFLAEKLVVKYKQLNYGVFFVDTIARNSNGKLLRAKMKEICLEINKETGSKVLQR
ncbi:probable 4-coumarate--CoA ligase 3 [Bactrocera tryoni]|uniref:probable 4-coumarate--CoA ligase 3 n=1 Tax=Bactrocera tryoni TaxID=59916 RepID=UPI001A96FE7F|nr:probable 4-coumarate--CoA ligase 3 [Bactrocera tryoni]